MNTRQSPIWIKRWPAALSAGSACLGSYEPQKTFGNPDRVQVAWDSACSAVRSDRVVAHRRMRLVQSRDGSEPGRIQYIATAPKREGMSRMKGRVENFGRES